MGSELEYAELSTIAHALSDRRYACDVPRPRDAVRVTAHGK